VTVCGGFGSQSGGVAPYKYKVVAGALPTAMGLSGLSLTGTFVQNFGTNFTVDVALVSQPYKFTVAVTDALGATGSISAIFGVFQHITLFAPSTGCVGNFLTGRSVQLVYSGGTPGGSIDVSTSNVLLNGAAATLPSGYSAVADTASQTVTITFPSGISSGWSGSIDLTLTDQSPCGPGPVLCSSSPAVTVTVTLAGS